MVLGQILLAHALLSAALLGLPAARLHSKKFRKA